MFNGGALVESKEMKYITRSIAGTISHLYRHSLEYNEGNPTDAKAEINALPSHLGANNKKPPKTTNFVHLGNIAGVTTKEHFSTNLLRLTTLTIYLWN